MRPRHSVAQPSPTPSAPLDLAGAVPLDTRVRRSRLTSLSQRHDHGTIIWAVASISPSATAKRATLPSVGSWISTCRRRWPNAVARLSELAIGSPSSCSATGNEAVAVQAVQPAPRTIGARALRWRR